MQLLVDRVDERTSAAELLRRDATFAISYANSRLATRPGLFRRLCLPLPVRAQGALIGEDGDPSEAGDDRGHHDPKISQPRATSQPPKETETPATGG